MKGILKIYHPDETLKYHIQTTYCKAVYSNTEHFLEVEIITDDSLDHVDDDSLQYHFPQIALNVSDFPIEDDQLEGQSYQITDSQDEIYTAVDLYDDEDAYVSENKLRFQKDSQGELELFWDGHLNDFYTGSQESIPFKLKCNFRKDEILVDED